MPKPRPDRHVEKYRSSSEKMQHLRSMGLNSTLDHEDIGNADPDVLAYEKNAY